MSQIIQEEDGRIIIKLVPGKHFKKVDECSLLDKMQSVLGKGIEMNIEYVETIERTQSGKFQWIISKKGRI